MAKLTKEELIKKVSEKIEDTDLQLELMEDITDSFMDGEDVDKAELDKVSKELADLKEKYRSRFLEVKEVVEAVEEAKEEVTDSEDELKEEEVIDIQEI
jgi:hypothetical protein